MKFTHVKASWFRAKAYIKHQLTAWNRRGDGIHSPYLFYLVDKILRDKNSYYCWQDIEDRRQAMLHAPKIVHTTDYGTGKSGEKLVSDIARRELESTKIAQTIFRITQWLGNSEKRPLNIIELGTSLGITTAYLASANTQNRVFTFEGSHEIADIANRNWQKLHINNIQTILGNIDDTLPDFLSHSALAKEGIDIAYLDANHTYEATIRYLNILRTCARDKSIFILDDIHHSPEMEKAWTEIQHRSDVTSTMDLYHIGLVFFDPHYLHKNYRL